MLHTMVNLQYKKVTQALRYLISKSDGDKINILLLMKLIWAADRYHARKYASLITDDGYRALPKGPISSIAYDIANGSEFLSPEQIEYSQRYLTRSDRNVVGHECAEKDYLAETDSEALDFAWNTFGRMDRFTVVDIAHEYPEWSKFKTYFQSGGSSEDIDVLDFFNNPQDDKFFAESTDLLKVSKAKFEEDLALGKIIRG